MPDSDAVTVTVSDPWEFPDENEGRLAFVAQIVGEANSHLLLRFLRPIRYQGRMWNFAIPSNRFVGQIGFDDTERAANILFITDEQASSQAFLMAYDSKVKPQTPWVVGSVARGIIKLIPAGEDSYVERTWKPPK